VSTGDLDQPRRIAAMLRILAEELDPTITRATSGARRGAGLDRIAQAAAIDHYLTDVRQCVAACGYTLEALGQALGGLDAGHVSRLLNGDRPWRLEHLVMLPTDVQMRLVQRRGEALGLIVVAPTDGAEATRHLVSGLLGLLAPKPARAARMLSLERTESQPATAAAPRA